MQFFLSHFHLPVHCRRGWKEKFTVKKAGWGILGPEVYMQFPVLHRLPRWVTWTSLPQPHFLTRKYHCSRVNITILIFLMHFTMTLMQVL